MKISVAIPAYNCAATIRETLDSVLRQTAPADEILVLNDGSTDETLSILHSYGERITVLSWANRGLGAARDFLSEHAQGDVIAFLDSDDIWHTRYLEVVRSLYKEHPNAAAYITGHVNFIGSCGYEWASDPFKQHAPVEVIAPLPFIKRYNRAPGPFIMDCCVPKRTLAAIGKEAFRLRLVEDLYFFNLVAAVGPIVFLPKPMVAYRIREGSLSFNRLKLTEAEVQAFELLAKRYEEFTDKGLKRAFRHSFAAKRRLHAKVLLGAGQVRPARDQLRRSLVNKNPLSLAKSVRLLLLSYLPAALQPTWPSAFREWKSPQGS